MGGQILIINIGFSLFFALIIISSLKHTQLSKVQSANKIFLSLLFLSIFSMTTSHNIYTIRKGHQGIDIKPDTPINVSTWFCLNTAKSKFSLVSPVAGWWETINKQLNWMIQEDKQIYFLTNNNTIHQQPFLFV